MLPRLLVSASAGTGKTYRLAGRLLQLLFMNADPASILATTFTRKAAGEILHRILVSLAHAANDEKKLSQLREQVQIPDLSTNQCQLLLQQLMREIHRLRICTLDSLFSQLARCFPVELHLPPGWRLTDEIEEHWLRRRAIDSMLASIDPDELATLISMLHKGEAARSLDGEIQRIILDGLSESRWAAKNAWTKLQVPNSPPRETRVQAATLLSNADFNHKTVNKQLRAIAEDIEANHLDALVDRSLVSLAGAHRKGDPPLTYCSRELNDEIIEALKVCSDHARNHTLGLLHSQTKATGEILHYYQQHIDSLKQQVRAFSFDDVAFRLASWMQSIDFQELANRMDADLRHILLDEFQDTSPLQWAVLRPLAAGTHTDAASEATEHTAAKPGSFFCVGDTKQAIYSWRGGRAAIFDAVTNELPDVQTATQNKSYRSSPVIMDFVNRVFKNLSKHPKLGDGSVRNGSTPKGSQNGDDQGDVKEYHEKQALRAFETNFPLHESGKPDLPGYVALKTVSADSNFKELADEIAAIAQASPERSIGVLTRTNRTVANLIYPLKNLGLDVSQEGGNPLTDSPLVELILSALMLAEHPGDLRWAYHVSHSPLSRLLHLAPLQPASGDAWNAQLNQVSEAADLVRKQLDYRGLAATLRWLTDPLIEIASQNDVLRMRQLLMLAHSYESSPQSRITHFVDLVRKKRVQMPRPAQIRVMTVHQSKGLEFDVVVLLDLESQLTRPGSAIISRSETPSSPPQAMLRYVGSKRWGLLPQDWQIAFGQQAAAQLTEALCLLYVAVTRPRHELHMLIKPATKADFSTRTPASLLFHALSTDADPTLPNTLLFALDQNGTVPIG